MAKRKQKLLLQVDVEGSTKFLQSSKFSTEVVSGLQELSNHIINCLQSSHNSQLVAWRGDGGIFAFDSDNLVSLDFAIPAAEEAARVFYEWQSAKPGRSLLGFRVSLHDGEVYVHDNTGLWLSRDLSTFAKYERDISISDALAITEQVRQHLSERVGKQFPDSTRRDKYLGENSNGDALIKRIYYKSLGKTRTAKHAADDPVISLNSFVSKLAQLIGDQPLIRIGPTSSVRSTLGATAMLYAISRPTAQITIGLRLSKVELGFALNEEEKQLLAEMAREKVQDATDRNMADNSKISPDRVTFPLTDVPYLIIDWHPEKWSLARSFHSLLEKRPELCQRLARTAADVQETGFRFPGILCMHTIIRIASDDSRDKPYILLCQRNIKGHEGHYYEGKWSCSMEENSKPGEEIVTSIKRGVAEELLGDNSYDYISAKPVAIFLENPYLNLTVLAVATVPLTFSEVVTKWKREAADKDEHRQLIALPLEWNAILHCIRTGQLAQSVWEKCLKSDEEIFRNTTTWDLHPTSLLRLATAFWLEQGVTQF